MTVDDGTAAPGRTWQTQPQAGRLTLTLDTHGLGCSRVAAPPANETHRVFLPVKLGPLECQGAVTTEPGVEYGLGDGMTRTTWTVHLAAIPDGFAVADLLEALGWGVTR